MTPDMNELKPEEMECVTGGLGWRDEAKLTELIKKAKNLNWSLSFFLSWLQDKYGSNTPAGWIDDAIQYINDHW